AVLFAVPGAAIALRREEPFLAAADRLVDPVDEGEVLVDGRPLEGGGGRRGAPGAPLGKREEREQEGAHRGASLGPGRQRAAGARGSADVSGGFRRAPSRPPSRRLGRRGSRRPRAAPTLRPLR